MKQSMCILLILSNTEVSYSIFNLQSLLLLSLYLAEAKKDWINEVTRKEMIDRAYR